MPRGRDAAPEADGGDRPAGRQQDTPSDRDHRFCWQRSITIVGSRTTIPVAGESLYLLHGRPWVPRLTDRILVSCWRYGSVAANERRRPLYVYRNEPFSRCQGVGTS